MDHRINADSILDDYLGDCSVYAAGRIRKGHSNAKGMKRIPTSTIFTQFESDHIFAETQGAGKGAAKISDQA